MKKKIVTWVVFILLVASVPLLTVKLMSVEKHTNTEGALASGQTAESEETKASTEKATEEIKPAEKETESAKNIGESELKASAQKKNNRKFKILNTDTGKTEEIPDYDFVVKVLAKEMPPSYEKEALKAQATAIYTYYSRLRSDEEEKKSDNLNGADFSYSGEKDKMFFTEEELKKKWGGNFEKNFNLLCGAVDDVFPYIITYDNQPIYSVYCECTAGVTESGEISGIKNTPYLKSVASPFDSFSSGFTKTYSFSSEEAKELITVKWDDVKLSESFQEWFSQIEYRESGNVESLYIGDKKADGKTIQKVFGLKSSCFDILYSLDEFIFTVKGEGDFIGMSKYGANEMAKQGADFKEILKYYYDSVEIKIL